MSALPLSRLDALSGRSLSGESTCWKTAYSRRASAQRVAKRRRGDEGIELHPYLCHCGKYHLSSKAPSEFRAQGGRS